MTAATLDPHVRPRSRPRRGATVVGVLGELMITVGVLLGLFLVWQLWWTDVVADRAQAQVIEELGWAVTSADGVDGPATSGAPVDPPANEPEPRTDGAPTLPEPEYLTTFGTLQVPRWGADYARPITQGVGTRDILDVLGLGHYEGTAMPGQIGNFSVAGHRTTYGKPLNRVQELVVGDALVVQTPETWYVYRVTETKIVTPRDVQVIAPVPGDPDAVPTVASMTLTTCHPMFSAQERFIVHAELDYWLPVADGTPPELTGGP